MYLTGEQHDHRSGRGGRTGVWPGVADGTGGCFYWAHSWTWVCWGWGWSVAKAAGIWQSLGDLQQQPHYFGLGLRWAALKSKRKEFQDVFFRPKRDMIDSKYILFLQQICVVKIDIFIRSSLGLCNGFMWMCNFDLQKSLWFESEFCELCNKHSHPITPKKPLWPSFTLGSWHVVIITTIIIRYNNNY